jgi:hypothetical protein
MQTHIVLKPGAVITATISSTASALTAPANDVVGCILTVETSDIRMRADGTNPTVASGLPMVAASVWEISGRDIIAAMKFIATGSDAKVTRFDLIGE